VGYKTDHGAFPSFWETPKQRDVAVLRNMAVYYFYDILSVFVIVVNKKQVVVS